MTALTHYIEKREQLTRLLLKLAQTPELLGNQTISHDLTGFITRYCGALQAIQDAKETNESTLFTTMEVCPDAEVMKDPCNEMDWDTLERVTSPDVPETPVRTEEPHIQELPYRPDTPGDPFEFDALHGKRILCVGGSGTAHQKTTFKIWFSPASLKWVDSEKGKGVRCVQRICKKIKSGKFDVVCMMVRSMSHAETDMIRKTCRKSAHTVHLITLESGFGKTAWIDGIRRASPPVLNMLDT